MTGKEYWAGAFSFAFLNSNFGHDAVILEPMNSGFGGLLAGK
jgi:hypothetical protein